LEDDTSYSACRSGLLRRLGEYIGPDLFAAVRPRGESPRGQLRPEISGTLFRRQRRHLNSSAPAGCQLHQFGSGLVPLEVTGFVERRDVGVLPGQHLVLPRRVIVEQELAAGVGDSGLQGGQRAVLGQDRDSSPAQRFPLSVDHRAFQNRGRGAQYDLQRRAGGRVHTVFRNLLAAVIYGLDVAVAVERLARDVHSVGYREHVAEDQLGLAVLDLRATAGLWRISRRQIDEQPVQALRGIGGDRGGDIASGFQLQLEAVQVLV